MPDIERRAFTIPNLRVDAQEGQPQKILGHAAVYEQLSEDLGGFREKVGRGAFGQAIQTADVRALINHDPNLILGRSASGTLRLAEDETGLAFEIDPPDTQYARDLAVSIGRRDITGVSFGFSTISDNWQKIDGDWIRTLLDVELFDISPVVFPAYPQTDVALRGLKIAQGPEPPPDLTCLAVMRRRLELI